MEPSAAFSVVLLVAVIAAPGVIAAVRAENPPQEEPDYKPDAQLHALSRKLEALDEALMDLLAIELPRDPQIAREAHGAGSNHALPAHTEALTRADELLKQAEEATRRLPADAPQQARVIITLVLENADSAIYNHGLAAGASRALSDPTEREEGRDAQLRALDHALEQATRSWQRAHEEIAEFEILLAGDAATPLPFAQAI